MEEGIAHIFLVSKNTSKLKAKIEKTTKRKAFGNKTDKQKNRFFELIGNALDTHFSP